jgi:hypothetical protein
VYEWTWIVDFDFHPVSWHLGIRFGGRHFTPYLGSSLTLHYNTSRSIEETTKSSTGSFGFFSASSF